jgi:CheY-like chemotaxis protein/HPt (histidine-containing phosphotransfer) domain-containing protein
MMGGTIGYERREGGGSRFWFSAVFTRGAQAAETLPAAPPHVNGRRVIVVSTSSGQRRACSTYAASWGVEVHTASNGKVALERIRKASGCGRPFDLAILDRDMPDISGITVGRAIRADRALQRTAVVLLMRRGTPEESSLKEDPSVAAVLPKPVRYLQLFSCFDTVLCGAPAGDTTILGTAPKDAAAGTRRGWILIAEDNAINQKVAERMLEKLGFRVDTVGNGKEAVKAVEGGTYDLVLMDIQMPEMDGFEATSIIRDREKPGGRRIPIVAMTAHALKGYRERCLQSGMDDYLAKPIQRDTLTRLLEKYLGTPPAAKDGAGPAPAARGVFDRKVLLQRLEGDEELLREIAGEFARDLPRLLEDVAGAAAADSADKLNIAAHALKGSAAAIEAPALRDLARRLERAGREGDRDIVRRVVDELKIEADVLLEALVSQGLATRAVAS